jgi:hypothetical protein
LDRTAEPTALPTELPATATIVVEVPAIESPTPIATAEPQPSPTSILASSGAGGSTALSEVEGILSPTRLADVAKKTAIYTAGFFVFLGLFFGIKALLVLLIRRILP